MQLKASPIPSRRAMDYVTNHRPLTLLTFVETKGEDDPQPMEITQLQAIRLLGLGWEAHLNARDRILILALGGEDDA